MSRDARFMLIMEQFGMATTEYHQTDKQVVAANERNELIKLWWETDND